MVAILAVAVLAALSTPGCGDVPREERAGAVTAGGVSADATPSAVVLTGAALRIEPDPAAPPVRELASGTPLRVLDSVAGWLRVATWDDREGWVRQSEAIELSLWAHYQQALGGAPVSDLRPAFPLADGRWAVEAPFPSGITTASSVWIEGDTPRAFPVADIETVASACAGAHRMAILAAGPVERATGASAPRTRGPIPRLERARLALAGAPSPRLVRLALRPFDPDTAELRAVSRIADSLAAARGGGAVSWAPGGWRALGEGAVWVELVPSGEAPGPAAAALLLLGRGADLEAHVVGELPRGPDATPSVELLDAFSSAGLERPTLFVIRRLEYVGQHVDLYVARAEGVQRLYAGYPWGC